MCDASERPSAPRLDITASPNSSQTIVSAYLPVKEHRRKRTLSEGGIAATEHHLTIATAAGTEGGTQLGAEATFLRLRPTLVEQTFWVVEAGRARLKTSSIVAKFASRTR